MVQEHSFNSNLVTRDVVTKKMDIFYNPLMVSNRNISINVIKTLKPGCKIALPLAGSGVRAIRIKNETEQKNVLVNDLRENFSLEGFESFNMDANDFLSKEKWFDYIDLDPFGSPNPFLARAIEAISRDGILAVTATDTAALTGTYPKVTRRKYWAETQRTYMMHEIGLRILIRKIQLIGVQYDKCLTPILSYNKDHYFRIYLRVSKGKIKCDKVLDDMKYIHIKGKNHKINSKNFEENHVTCGPMYCGKILDYEFLKKINENNIFPEEKKFLEILLEESKSSMVGYFDLHHIAKQDKTNPKRMKELLKNKNYTPTHFSSTGYKTI